MRFCWHKIVNRKPYYNYIELQWGRTKIDEIGNGMILISQTANYLDKNYFGILLKTTSTVSTRPTFWEYRSSASTVWIVWICQTVDAWTTLLALFTLCSSFLHKPSTLFPTCPLFKKIILFEEFRLHNCSCHVDMYSKSKVIVLVQQNSEPEHPNLIR